MTIKRKVWVVSVYYKDDNKLSEPQHCQVDELIYRALFKSKSLGIFDLVTEETRPWLFNMNTPRFITSRVYKFLINRKKSLHGERCDHDWEKEEENTN